jgi:hypothetical protein
MPLRAPLENEAGRLARPHCYDRIRDALRHLVDALASVKMRVPDAQNPYTQLDLLVQGYLNQDADYWADSVEGVVLAYARDANSAEQAELLDDLERFCVDHSGRLEEAFHDAYWFDFEPKNIGKTVPEFFDTIRKTLAEAGKTMDD